MQRPRHALVIFILVFIPGIFLVSDRGPVADETVYVGYAYALYTHDVYGLATNSQDIPPASARVAPVLPWYISMVMQFSKPFAASIHCFMETRNKQDECADGFRIFKFFNLAAMSLLLALTGILLITVTGSLIQSYLILALILLTGAPYYFADHFLTETLYVPLAFVFYLAFALAVYEIKPVALFGSGLLLGVLALIRPSFFYLFIIMVCLLPVILVMMKRIPVNSIRSIIQHLVFFVAGFSIIIAPWLIRNYMVLDKPAVTIGYAAYPLSSRVAYNRMTNAEYMAAWIYWLPDFGDSLAEDLFGTENTRRLNFGSPDGFILKDRQVIRNEAVQATGTGLGIAKTPGNASPVTWLIDKHIIGDFFNHVKVTLVMAWRGLFIEKYFGLLGFFTLLWAISGGMRDRQRTYLLLICLPVFILVLFHAFLTVSIPRYNLSLLLPMAISMAFALRKAADKGMGLLTGSLRTKP